MTWTYNSAQLTTNEVYAIRAEIQDTDPLDQQLQDEEISYAIANERNYWCASARCLEMIARSKLRKADVKLGRMMMITYTKMATQLQEEAKRLRAKSLGTVAPFVGGMSVSDKQAYTENTDIVAPMFTKTMQENPWTSGYTSDSLSPVANDPDTDSLSGV